MTIYNHTDLLNYLATTFNLQSYLEIGVRKPELNFDKIKLPNSSVKFGIDPEITETHSLFKQTSDEFFADYIEAWEKYFDLIFIDGLHHANQVKRDFENSLKCLTDHGFILIHDTLPTHEKYTHVPRDSRIWYGDVWKFAFTLPYYSNVLHVTLDVDCGCTIVWKDNKATSDWDEAARKILEDSLGWQDFEEYKKYNLNIHSVNDFKIMMQDHLHSHAIFK